MGAHLSKASEQTRGSFELTGIEDLLLISVPVFSLLLILLVGVWVVNVFVVFAWLLLVVVAMA